MRNQLRWMLIVGLVQAASLANAQDGKPAEDPKGKPKHAAHEHVERASEELKEASKAAAEEAREKLHKTGEEMRESMQEAREQAKQALEQARKQAEESGENADEALKEAKEEAKVVLKEAREQARSFFEQAREQTRKALLNAAESLDSKQDDTTKQKQREERKDAARREQWQELKKRLDENPNTQTTTSLVSGTGLSRELALHARRTARLSRIRALADQQKDAPTVARCDALLSLELARHERRMLALLKQPEAPTEEKTP